MLAGKKRPFKRFDWVPTIYVPYMDIDKTLSTAMAYKLYVSRRYVNVMDRVWLCWHGSVIACTNKKGNMSVRLDLQHSL